MVLSPPVNLSLDPLPSRGWEGGGVGLILGGRNVLLWLGKPWREGVEGRASRRGVLGR